MNVSVVIPNYNYGKYISAAIQSVIDQSFPCIEIIVIDDGSIDNSLEVLKSWGDRIKVFSQPNLGVGKARNKGVELSKGELIAFLDADDCWYADKIKRQIKVFEEYSDTVLVSCSMREFDKDGETIQIIGGPEGVVDSLGILKFNTPFVCSGSAIMIKKEFFEKIGGFDTSKELHPSEDWEFFFRVSEAGKIRHIMEPLVDYRNHGNNGHLKVPYMERAMRLAYQKIYSQRPEIKRFKRISYSNLFFVLAGSYFHLKMFRPFIRTSLLSVWFSPLTFFKFFNYPIKAMRKRYGITPNKHIKTTIR